MNNQSIPRVSIIIKALNEEAHIAESIQSALNALSGINGEVILADSLSTDATIEIAKQYPIKIVQIKNLEERCCGAGPQLGYQYAKGDFIYILDGDMVIEPDFISAALGLMSSDSRLAGVAGRVEEFGGGNYEFERRKKNSVVAEPPGEKQWLGMGGLYRRSAIEAIGWFSNQNLHSCEEMELGLRLVHAGWKLVRLDRPAIKHYGHSVDTFALLKRRWRSRYLWGIGEVFRAAWGEAYLWDIFRSFSKFVLVALIWIWTLLGLLLLPLVIWPVLVGGGMIAGLFIVMLVKQRSFKRGITSFIYVHAFAAGLLLGMFSPQVNPKNPISSIVLKAE